MEGKYRCHRSNFRNNSFSSVNANISITFWWFYGRLSSKMDFSTDPYRFTTTSTLCSCSNSIFVEHSTSNFSSQWVEFFLIYYNGVIKYFIICHRFAIIMQYYSYRWFYLDCAHGNQPTSTMFLDRDFLLCSAIFFDISQRRTEIGPGTYLYFATLI